MILIGIAGPAQSGKSTLAGEFRRLVEFRGQKFSEQPFAGPLKRMLASIGVDVSDLSKNCPVPFLDGKVTPRVMMQTLGTEWGRALLPHLWLCVWQHELDDSAHCVCVPDVRFDNEAGLIRSLGGTIVHISRKPTAEMLAVPAHASETGIARAKGDIIFRNDRGIEKMSQFAASILDNAK
jgi:hypothetical protein|nr:MAG TPA: deoxynucleoside monophosphate kinase [Caudoviricetes sp.]